MTKFLLEDREANYYDDSDFYAIFFDTETGTIRSEMYGSTRGFSPRVAPADVYLREIPADVMTKAIEYLFEKSSEDIARRDRIEIDSPDNVSRGDCLTLLMDGKYSDKKTGVKVEYKAGESAVVIWEGAFGTFYRNGYNRKGRSNTRVGLRFEDGRVVFIGLDKCKLSRPYLSEEEISQRARSYAEGKNFSFFYSR